MVWWFGVVWKIMPIGVALDSALRLPPTGARSEKEAGQGSLQEEVGHGIQVAHAAPVDPILHTASTCHTMATALL